MKITKNRVAIALLLLIIICLSYLVISEACFQKTRLSESIDFNIERLENWGENNGDDARYELTKGMIAVIERASDQAHRDGKYLPYAGWYGSLVQKIDDHSKPLKTEHIQKMLEGFRLMRKDIYDSDLVFPFQEVCLSLLYSVDEN